MTEALPSWWWEIIPKEQQQIPPALQELKKLIGPSNIPMVVRAYENFSDSQKTSLLQKIQKNNDGIGAFIEIEDNTSLQTLLNKIIIEITKDTKANEADTKANEADTKANEVANRIQKEKASKESTDTTATETNESAEVRELLLKEAREQRDAAYKLFDDEDGFNQKFGKDAIKWREEATRKVLSEPGADKLSEEEKKTRIDVSILVTNRESIAAGLPEGSARTEFKAIAGKLNFIATELRIPIEPRLAHVPITNTDKNKITTELVGLKPTDQVTQTGSTFKYGNEKEGYQVVDISTRPPTRSTEQFGIRITASGDKAKEEKKLKNKFYEGTEKKENELSRLRVLMGDINNKVSGEKADLNKIAVDTFCLSPIETLDEKSYDILIKACDKATEAETNETDKEFSRKLKFTIQAKKDKYLEPMGLQAQQSFLPNILINIQDIEQQLTTDKLTYQASLSKFAENERSNLSLLNKSWFSVLGQEKLNFSVSFINDSRKGQTSLNPIDLWVPLNQKDENALIRIVQLQLWEEHKGLFVVDENNNTKLAPGDGVQEKVKSALFAIKNISLETFRARMGGHDLTKPVEYKKTETSSDSWDKQKPDWNQEKP